MDTTDAFTGLACVDCGDRFTAAAATHRCPDCGGILDPTYDLDAVDLTREALAERPFDSMWRYGELLPFSRGSAVTLGEGATPLVECPALAEAYGVGRVLLKDEGRNPTATFKDRGHAMAVTAAAAHGATDVALASAGNAGQSAAAYAARAGLDAHVFLPERAGFTQKAMVEVHGGELTTVEGGIGGAGAAFQDALDAHDDWYPTATFVTPYRHEGKKTMGHEILEQLNYEAPDAIVYPTGGGVGLVGVHKAAKEFRELGLVDDLPPLYAAQSTGCAPIVEAWESGRPVHEAWAEPDTVCAGIEIPDPGASPLVLEAMRESDGGAVAMPDDDILEAALEVARLEGLEMGATPAAAAAGARALSERGALGPDATVVLLSTGAGVKDADVLRSHALAGV
ncbi:MAG: threonine synthase [Halobacteriales archaeon]|nr:threonine synthase [Halobacteriales archaeon]